MKQILFSAVFSLLAILLIPPFSQTGQAPAIENIVEFTEAEPASEESFIDVPLQPEDKPETLRLLCGDTVDTLSLDDYLTCVVLSEMPPEFEPEALKAQAVAARTFLEKRRLSHKHPNADVCADSACCQAWTSETALREKFGADFEAYAEKARAAVTETSGEVLTYDGALIDATYFSCSGGKTEDALAVWGSDVPYLQSVPSYGEENALRYRSEASFSADELRTLLGDNTLTGPLSGWFGAVTHTDGGGVASMQIGKHEYAGTELRRLLGLNSTCFTVSVQDERAVFHVLGYGHRVGMSQYGANYMAQQGYDYRVILQYYYRGAEIQKAAV